MEKTSLLQYLQNRMQVDEESMHKISLLQTRQVAKGEFLLRAGEISRYMYYVEKGLLSYYSIDEKGKPHIIQFAEETWFMSDRCSLFFQQTSPYFIEALEDSEITVIPRDFFSELSKTSPAFVMMNTQALHHHILHLQNRIHQLLAATAEERYLDFVKLYPSLTLRIPQTMIAAFLGITPESLSRVRKELAQKNESPD